MTKTNIEKNIFSENIHKNLNVDEKKAIQTARKILDFYLKDKEIFEKSCLAGYDFNCISFDILYCDNEKTHAMNKEYREKDYAADIITFAIFADSEDKFIFDGEINLGEIIISLDKVLENGKCKMENVKSETKNLSAFQPFSLSTDFEDELYFLIAHGIMHLLGFDHQTNEDYDFIIKAQTSALK
jgi:probable rRNA maturation factor